MRAKTGLFAAPGVALALGDAASCLMHQSGTAAAAHVQEGAQPEHVVAHQHHEMQVDQHAAHHADAGHAMPEPHQHDGKSSMGPCCAMLCVSAIVADLPAIAKPSQPISLCVAENVQRLPDKAPPLLYRPPIA